MSLPQGLSPSQGLLRLLNIIEMVLGRSDDLVILMALSGQQDDVAFAGIRQHLFDGAATGRAAPRGKGGTR